LLGCRVLQNCTSWDDGPHSSLWVWLTFSSFPQVSALYSASVVPPKLYTWGHLCEVLTFDL
jgi:hypothetical protein